MNIKKMLCLILATVLCIGVLSGCGELENMIPGFGRQDPSLLDRPPETAGLPDQTPPTMAPTEAVEVPVATEPASTEPAPTEPKPTEAPKPANLLKANQKKINVFLSNFAEQGFGNYPDSDVALLTFGYLYYKYNVDSKLHVDEDAECYYVKKKDMDTVLKDFFGKTITPDDYEEFIGAYHDDVIFDNDRYEFPLADGVLADYVAVASSMVDNGDGTYTVEFDVYFAEDGLKNSYYEYNAEKAASSSKLSWEYSGKAVVREHTRSTGKESYRLIRLETN